ncbi:hypothetical protein [Marinilabilia sp.]|uniref:hypothetical protein n=1 Tax=Marinilabilia sp. TaxID=2021252 RepID=UPI0025B97A79|nr:hypothetical protein [Marinilabilia sp.]
MNKTFNFITGALGTAGTLQMVDPLPDGGDEISSLVMLLTKTLISLLGGILTNQVAKLFRKKSDKEE